MKETIETLISAEEIGIRVKEIAAAITRDYAGKSIILLGMLKGAIHFISDIARAVDLPAEIDFMKASSYGNTTTSSGNVVIDHRPTAAIEGRHVIIVEDIVDTGHTVTLVKEHLLAQNPASLRICALLDKPSRRVVNSVVIDYLGFSIPDQFVVGYGLDYAQQYRQLPFVGVVIKKGEN